MLESGRTFAYLPLRFAAGPRGAAHERKAEKMKWKIRKCVCSGCGGQWWMQLGTSPRFYVDSFEDAIAEAVRLDKGPVPGNPKRYLRGPWTLGA